MTLVMNAKMEVKVGRSNARIGRDSLPKPHADAPDRSQRRNYAANGSVTTCAAGPPVAASSSMAPGSSSRRT